MEQKKERIILGITIAALILVIAISIFAYSQKKYIKTDEIEVPIVKIVEDPFENVSVSAKAAIIWDVKNQKVIFSKNAEEVLPMASLTKLMTALATVELVPEDSTIRITRESLQEEGKPEVLLGERWKPRDLLALTLMSSSNAAARAAATAAGAFINDGPINDSPHELFISHINARAKNLNLSSIRFYNDSGLDIDEENSGAYGSAKDIAKLIDYILQNNPEILEATKHSNLKIVSEDNIVHDIKNTNTMVENIPGIIGSKTGFTDLAQGNLVVAFSPGLDGPYIAVVLGSTYNDRFNDINRLVEATVRNAGQ